MEGLFGGEDSGHEVQVLLFDGGEAGLEEGGGLGWEGLGVEGQGEAWAHGEELLVERGGGACRAGGGEDVSGGVVASTVASVVIIISVAIVAEDIATTTIVTKDAVTTTPRIAIIVITKNIVVTAGVIVENVVIAVALLVLISGIGVSEPLRQLLQIPNPLLISFLQLHNPLNHLLVITGQQEQRLKRVLELYLTPVETVL